MLTNVPIYIKVIVPFDMSKRVTDWDVCDSIVSEEHDVFNDIWELHNFNRSCSLKKNVDERSHKHDSEIIWSEENGNLLPLQGVFQSFSNKASESERTTSSCSWHCDEFEAQSAERIKASLEAVESALYEGERHPALTQELFEECQEWAKMFPYLRLKGNKIVDSADDDKPLCNIPSQVQEYLSNINSSHIYNHINFDELVDFEEEIIAQDGEYEECSEIYKNNMISKANPSICCNDDSSDLFSDSSVNYVKQKVLEQLTLKIWPEVLAVWQSSRGSKSPHLPPIPLVESQSSQKSATGSRNSIASDMCKLEEILMVSPKVLQKRSDIRMGSGVRFRSRPSTAFSTQTKTSNAASTSPYHNYCHLAETRYSQTGRKTRSSDSSTAMYSSQERKASYIDTFGMYLPVLQEGASLFPDALHGTHIKPDVKESTYGSISNDTFYISPKSYRFLPPINDTDQNIQQNSNRSVNSHIARVKYMDKIDVLEKYPSRVQSSLTKKNANSAVYRGSIENADSTINVSTNRKNSISSSDQVYGSSIQVKNFQNIDNVQQVTALFPIVSTLEQQREVVNKRNSKQSGKKKSVSSFKYKR